MKKKNLKSLQLNKKSISNLESHKTQGGTVLTAFCPSVIYCPTQTCNCTEGDICITIDITIDVTVTVTVSVINQTVCPSGEK